MQWASRIYFDRKQIVMDNDQCRLRVRDEAAGFMKSAKSNHNLLCGKVVLTSTSPVGYIRIRLYSDHTATITAAWRHAHAFCVKCESKKYR